MLLFIAVSQFGVGQFGVGQLGHYCTVGQLTQLSIKVASVNHHSTARAFVPGKPFQPSLKFVGEARSLP
jgi:hypothetical protein